MKSRTTEKFTSTISGPVNGRGFSAERFSKQVDYIISYRESTPDRKNAINFVVSWLHNCFPGMNIVIVEQDTQPKLDLSNLPYCKHIFIYNPGLFNRGWSCNVGARATENRYLIFGDADVFMSKPAYTECFRYLQDFEAVDPKKNYLWNVDNIEIESLQYQIKSIRYGNTFGGGIFLIQRESFMSLEMWDEDFEGWGGEDNVMQHVIQSYLRHCRLQLDDIFHIDHLRTFLDGKEQPSYIRNSERSNYICSLHGERLLSYMEYKKKHSLGCKNKYVTGNSSDVRKPELNLQA